MFRSFFYGNKDTNNGPYGRIFGHKPRIALKMKEAGRKACFFLFPMSKISPIDVFSKDKTTADVMGAYCNCLNGRHDRHRA